MSIEWLQLPAYKLVKCWNWTIIPYTRAVKHVSHGPNPACRASLSSSLGYQWATGSWGVWAVEEFRVICLFWPWLLAVNLTQCRWPQTLLLCPPAPPDHCPQALYHLQTHHCQHSLTPLQPLDPLPSCPRLWGHLAPGWIWFTRSPWSESGLGPQMGLIPLPYTIQLPLEAIWSWAPKKKVKNLVKMSSLTISIRRRIFFFLLKIRKQF